MFHSVFGRCVALAGLLATIGLAVVAFAPSAGASPYCGGTLAGNASCTGAARSLSGVSGYGLDHSVCVAAGGIGMPCSGGPGQIATLNLGFTAVLAPWIANNAAGSNRVQGDTF